MGDQSELFGLEEQQNNLFAKRVDACEVLGADHGTAPPPPRAAWRHARHCLQLQQSLLLVKLLPSRA
jgi:hypothetical protein